MSFEPQHFVRLSFSNDTSTTYCIAEFEDAAKLPFDSQSNGSNDLCKVEVSPVHVALSTINVCGRSYLCSLLLEEHNRLMNCPDSGQYCVKEHL